MNTTVTGGLTVGAEVKNMPIILEGRTSIYEEAVKNGVFNGTFSEFVESLSGKVQESVLVEQIDSAVDRVFKLREGGNSSAHRNLGFYVLNDFLPSEIAEDLMRESPLLPELHSAAIQAAYDKLSPNNVIVKLFGNVKATKLRGYRSDLYGADNRSVPNRPDLTRHGGQPTMVVHGVGVTLDLSGCVYEVQDMYLDGIHLAQGNFIRNGTFRTKRIQDVDPNWEAAKQWRGGITGSKGEGNDWIPMLDADTGMGAKGTATSGFNITISANGTSGAPSYELAAHRSNSIDTSKLSSGGYGGQFPQADGTKAATWGSWFGGWHGNLSAAIVIFTFPGTPEYVQKNTQVGVCNCNIRGWIGEGIAIGLRGTLDGDYLGNTDMDVIMQYVPHNVVIKDNVICDVYSSGIQRYRYINMIETGNRVYRSGHPDWSLDHKKRESPTIVSVDPGYGTSSGREIPQVNLYIGNFTAIDCARKGVDAHTGTDTVIENFRIKSGYYGISIAIEEQFSNPREDSSAGHQLSRYIIRNGDIDCANYGIHVINGALSERNDGRAWDFRNIFLMDGLNIKAPRPYYNNYGRGGFTLSNSVLAFGAPYPLKSGVSSYEALYLGSENPNNRGIPIDATLQNIQIVNTSKGNFKTGIEILPLRKLHISNVTVHTQPYTVNSNAVAAWAGESTMIRSGEATVPLVVRAKPIVAYGGGNTAYDQATQLHTSLDDLLGIVTNSSVTTVPTANSATAAAEKFSAGILKFDAATVTEDSITSNDSKAVISAVGEYPTTGYTLIATDDMSVATNTATAVPTANSATAAAEKFSAGILKFDAATVTGDSIISNDAKAVISAVGEYPPVNYILVKDEEL